MICRATADDYAYAARAELMHCGAIRWVGSSDIHGRCARPASRLNAAMCACSCSSRVPHHRVSRTGWGMASVWSSPYRMSAARGDASVHDPGSYAQPAYGVFPPSAVRTPVYLTAGRRALVDHRPDAGRELS